MKKSIILGLSVFLFVSCNNTAKNEEITTETHETETQAVSPDHNDATIELNNGEKWVVNEEMKPFVKKGAELVNVYIKDNKTDYKQLASQLTDVNNQLIKSCTMDGKSHEELHKWLHPHLEIVKELENEKDAVKAQKIVEELQYSYKVYSNYFK